MLAELQTIVDKELATDDEEQHDSDHHVGERGVDVEIGRDLRRALL